MSRLSQSKKALVTNIFLLKNFATRSSRRRAADSQNFQFCAWGVNRTPDHSLFRGMLYY